MANILVVFNYYQYPLRVAVRDHLYSFQKYSAHRCFYLNLALRKAPSYLGRIRFDLIIFHTVFLSSRWSLDAFKATLERARVLREMKCVKIALPQDEFMNTNVLCDFINEFGVQHVFSVAPESEWPKIYASIDFKQVHFHPVLTGYLDDDTIARVNDLGDRVRTRDIDIGYRAWRAEPWLGSHGMLKTRIADLFEEKAGQRGLRTDISTRNEDTLLGEKWYRFLLSCKYTIGVEGGASILDRDGKIRDAANHYLARHPDATFEEVREACFKGRVDDSLQLFAISPRHLEACLTRTCQVLVEGQYNGILSPGRHYIELKRNFENIDRVLDVIEKDTDRQSMVERAYRDVVESGAYSYRGFVRFLLEQSLGYVEPVHSSLLQHLSEIIVYYVLKVGEAASWIGIALSFGFYGKVRRRLPHSVQGLLRKLRWILVTRT